MKYFLDLLEDKNMVTIVVRLISNIAGGISEQADLIMSDNELISKLLELFKI